MARLLLLLLLAIPAYAQEPEAIVISPAERQALIDRFEAMDAYIKKLEKEFKTCLLIHHS